MAEGLSELCAGPRNRLPRPGHCRPAPGGRGAGRARLPRERLPLTGEPVLFGDLGIVLGARVVVRVIFSSEQPDLDPSPNVGDYRWIDVGMSVGQYFVGRESEMTPGITVRNDYLSPQEFPFPGRLSRDEYRVDTSGPHYVSDYDRGFGSGAILLVDATATVFSSDALPLVPPSLSDFATAEGWFSHSGIRFRLTSFFLVPEPASIRYQRERLGC